MWKEVLFISILAIVYSQSVSATQTCESGYSCVPYYLCTDPSKIKDGEGNVCSNFLEVCCPKVLQAPPDSVSSSTPATGTDNAPKDSCKPGRECLPYYQCTESSDIIDEPEQTETCANYLHVCCNKPKMVNEGS